MNLVKSTLAALLASAALLPGALPAAIGAAAGGAPRPPSSRYVPPLADVPMNQIVQQQLYPQLEYLFDKMVAEKEHVTIDGVEALKSNDKFLQGKIASGLAHVLLNMRKDDPRLQERLRQFREITDMTAGMDNHTWGIYYYLEALYQLKQAGLLEQAISPATLARLKTTLDWHTFVTPQWELIKLPTNYYGVAFSVARLRMLLGWEDESASKVLLDKMMTHYATYSGKFGFSDETPGEGRFDRYSVLLVAEICERFIETGMEVTPELKALLRKSADIVLNFANTAGEGFTWGRSLGPYGETAALEILSVSAYLGILTPEEKQYAYAYANRIVAKYMDFWTNPAMHSVDMWNEGRRTDTYRAKHRILGENFSLSHQLIFTTDFWNAGGHEGCQAEGRTCRPGSTRRARAFSTTWFARGEYDRALAIYRDKGHVFSLAMINGGDSQYDNSPYYPLPFASGVVPARRTAARSTPSCCRSSRWPTAASCCRSPTSRTSAATPRQGCARQLPPGCAGEARQEGPVPGRAHQAGDHLYFRTGRHHPHRHLHAGGAAAGDARQPGVRVLFGCAHAAGQDGALRPGRRQRLRGERPGCLHGRGDPRRGPVPRARRPDGQPRQLRQQRLPLRPSADDQVDPALSLKERRHAQDLRTTLLATLLLTLGMQGRPRLRSAAAGRPRHRRQQLLHRQEPFDHRPRAQGAQRRGDETGRRVPGCGGAPRQRLPGPPSNREEARCGLQWLSAWARQDAMLGKMTTNQSYYTRKWALGGLALSYARLRPAANEADRQAIDAWLRPWPMRPWSMPTPARACATTTITGKGWRWPRPAP
jgi:hypothetical protein